MVVAKRSGFDSSLERIYENDLKNPLAIKPGLNRDSVPFS
jgi:hypothetical protein